MGRTLSRRTVLLGTGAVGATIGAGAYFQTTHVPAPLFSETVAFTRDGRRAEVGKPDLPHLLPRSRCHRDAPAHLVRAERDWRASLPAWTHGGPHADLVESAVLDLWVLSASLPAPVAAWRPYWRYVWPRDACHVAVALALLGRVEEAVRTLTWLAGIQDPTGWFKARYDPWRRASPDGRPRQLDGTAWGVWASAEVLKAHPGESDRLRRALHPFVRRSALLLTGLIGADGRLPASPDYWETWTATETLGTAAPVLAALEAARSLAREWGDSQLAEEVEPARALLRAAVDAGYAARGWPRSHEDPGLDAAVCFMAPPYQPQSDASVLAAVRRYQEQAARPAGGVAPGESWKNDGISWTPETALLGQAYAAAGHRAKADAVLAWLAAHRTRAGSIPEKVVFDGAPASVAPLAWTAAVVVRTVHALNGTGT